MNRQDVNTPKSANYSNQTISYMKAIAIMLMVLGHSFYNTYVESWVNMFHVPVFFFTAGYCFKESHLDNFKLFITKRIKGLYWPYLKWGVIFLLLHNFLYRMGIYNSVNGYSFYTLNDYASMLVKIVRMSGSERLLSGYWFLNSLLFGYILFYLVLLICKKTNLDNKRSVILGGVILYACSFLLNYLNIRVYPFGQREFLAAFFIWTGYSYKFFDLSFHKNTLTIIIALILVTFGSIYWKGSMGNLNGLLHIPYTLTAFVGVVGVFAICNLLDNAKPMFNKLLGFIGNNTLTVLTWHFSFFLISSFVLVKLFSLHGYQISEFPVIQEYASRGWGLMYFIISLTGSLILAQFNKYINSYWLKL